MARYRMIDGVLVALTTEEEAARAAEEAAWTPPPAERLIAKTTIYRRATDAEITAFQAFLSTQATLRQRLMWQDAEGGLVRLDDVEPLAVALFGEARAAVLLAPPTPAP